MGAEEGLGGEGYCANLAAEAFGVGDRVVYDGGFWNGMGWDEVAEGIGG